VAGHARLEGHVWTQRTKHVPMTLSAICIHELRMITLVQMHRLGFAKRSTECRMQARVFVFRPPPVHLGTSALQPVLVSYHLQHPFPIPFSSSAEHMPSLINILLLTRYHRRRTFLTRLPTCFRYFVRTSAAATISRTFSSQHRRAWVALPFLKQSLQLTVYSQ
jgi:hypothetical protein